jgi:murein DD-endopeptidase MepM/ murein hydrolase activator NlpD
MGQPIYASQAGVVVYAGSSTVGYGLLVIVDHLNGWHTLYAHLSQWNMSCGQQVYRGTVLGLAGSTGNSSGPHLHFEMRYNGGKENPWGLLP